MRKKLALVLLAVTLLNTGNLSSVKAEGRYISDVALRDDMLQRKSKMSYSMDANSIKYVTGLPQDTVPYLDDAVKLPDPDGTCGDYLAFSVREATVNGTYNSDGKGKLNYEVTYLTTYEQEAQLSTLANDIASKLQGKSDFEKAKYIHDYICNEATYDQTYTRFDAYSLLFSKSAVCEGYALGFYRLARAAKLNCRIVTGKASGDRVVNGTIQEGSQSTGDNHAWNVVLVDGQWYNVDVTWDDQESISYDYFLKNEADFSPQGATHERNAKYNTLQIAPISVDMQNPPGGSTPLSDERVTEDKANSKKSDDAKTATDDTGSQNWQKKVEAVLAGIGEILMSIIKFIASLIEKMGRALVEFASTILG